MRSTIAAQLRVVSTTRVALIAAAALAAFVLVTSLAPAALFGQHRDPHTILEGSATIAVVTAMLLGAVQSAGDLQNGMTRALLMVQPRRAHLLISQLLVSLVQGACLGIVATLLADATQSALGRLDLPAGSLLAVGIGTVVAASLSGVLGAAVGALCRSATVAGMVVVLWSYALEPFISTLSYSVYIYLPGGARESLVQHVSAHHYIPPPFAGAAILAAIASGAAVAATFAFERHDIT